MVSQVPEIKRKLGSLTQLVQQLKVFSLQVKMGLKLTPEGDISPVSLTTVDSGMTTAEGEIFSVVTIHKLN